MLRDSLRIAMGTSIALVSTMTMTGRALAETRVERSPGATSCPDTVAFSRRIAGGGGEVADAVVSVRFEHDSGGYRSTVVMSDGKRRVLTDNAPTCEALADATVLAVKLALDREPAPAAVVEVPAVSSSSPISDDPPDVAIKAPLGRRMPIAELSASGAVTFGIGSPVAAGARLGGAVVLGAGRWSIGLTGLSLPTRARAVGEGTVDVSVLSGGIEACRRAPLGTVFALALCARLEAMRMAGSAHGFARIEEHAVPLFAGTLLGRARARVVGPVVLFAEVGAVVPFVRERFGIDTLGVVYDPPLVAAATGIGVLVDFE